MSRNIKSLTKEQKKEIKDDIRALCDKYQGLVGMVTIVQADDDTASTLITGNLCPVCAQDILKEHIEKHDAQHLGQHKDNIH